MKPKRADKKNSFKKTKTNNFSVKDLKELIVSRYSSLFKVCTRSCTHVAEEYLSGLLQCEKAWEYVANGRKGE
jgi:hypothetical protein